MPASIVDALLREYRTRPMARFTAWLIAFGLALWVDGILSSGAPGLLWAIFIIGLLVASVYYAARLIKAIRHHILWHIRRRLIVTYVFIAVVPIALILVLVGLAVVIVNGQFAAFLVTLKVHDQVEEMRQVSRVVAHEAYISPAKTPDQLLDQLQRFYTQQFSRHSANYPGLQIALRMGKKDRAFYLDGKPIPRVPTVPPWLSEEEFSGVVSDHGKLFLRAVVQGEAPVGQIRMVLSEPFSSALLDMLGKGIGPVGVIEPAPGTKVITQPDMTSLTVRSGTNTHEQILARSKSIQLAPPANFLDFDVFGTSSLNVVIWNGTQERRLSQPVFVFVTSRLSILTHHLLSTLGRYSRIYLALFLTIGGVFLVIEILSLIVGIRLTRTVTGTVDKLCTATEHVRAGDLSHRINVPAEDQLSSLGEAFDNMTGSLQHLLAELQEKTRLEHDIQIAQEVQEQLFPSEAPKVPGLELYGLCRPARHVSGDYYDFLSMGTDRVGMVLGDVSGKGVSAALIMAAIQSLIRTHLYMDSSDGKSGSEHLSTAHFFGVLNQQMFENTPEEKYATCFYALYDSGSRQLVYTNAGHPAPILFRNGEIARLNVGGTPLGLISPMLYREAKLTLEPGDLLVAFTDGFVESENSFEDQFGENRLMEIIQRARGDSLAVLANEIFQSVEYWTGGGEPQDDMTLIIARAMPS